MRVALVSSPFLPVPPRKYGGTELFIAQLAEGLKKLRHRRSGLRQRRVDRRRRNSLALQRAAVADQRRSFRQPERFQSRLLGHRRCRRPTATSFISIMFPALMFTRFVREQIRVHHASRAREHLSAIYRFFPAVEFVTISDFQRRRESMPRMRTIHHGIDLNCYRLQNRQAGLSQLSWAHRAHQRHAHCHRGREEIRHSAEDCRRGAAASSGLISIAEIKPHIDGKFIEYVGEADLAAKNELLGNSLAHAVSHSVERAVRAGDDRSHGLRHAGAGVAGRSSGGSGVRWHLRFRLPTPPTRWRSARANFRAPSARRRCDNIVSNTSPLERMVADYVALYQELVERRQSAGQGHDRSCR